MPPGGSSELGFALKAIFYSLLIIFVPMTTYATSKPFLFKGMMGFNDQQSTIGGAVAAIVAVHVVLAFFIVQAYLDDRRGVVQGEKFD